MGLPTQRVPPERNGDHDKPEFGQPHEEILMLIIWSWLFSYI